MKNCLGCLSVDVVGNRFQCRCCRVQLRFGVAVVIEPFRCLVLVVGWENSYEKSRKSFGKRCLLYGRIQRFQGKQNRRGILFSRFAYFPFVSFIKPVKELNHGYTVIDVSHPCVLNLHIVFGSLFKLHIRSFKADVIVENSFAKSIL